MSDPEAPTTPDGDSPPPWRVRRQRDTRAFLSPVVQRLAAERGVDAGALRGTGSGGRVSRDDVVAASTGSAREVRGDEVVPFTRIRQRAAAALLESKRSAPHALCVVHADYTRVDEVRRAARDEFREHEGFSLTYLPFVARAVIDALAEFPLLNSTIEGDGLVVHQSVDLGFAVDLDYQGLVVPVVRGADSMRLREIACSVHDLATRARAKKLVPDDVAGATFTITNPGAAGTWISFPIINLPGVAILSTDGVSKQVVAVDDGDGRDRLASRPLGHLCLTFDHRAVDGAYAGAFLRRVQEFVVSRDWSSEL